jgi:hypothetical protein
MTKENESCQLEVAEPRVCLLSKKMTNDADFNLIIFYKTDLKMQSLLLLKE